MHSIATAGRHGFGRRHDGCSEAQYQVGTREVTTSLVCSRLDLMGPLMFLVFGSRLSMQMTSTCSKNFLFGEGNQSRLHSSWSSTELVEHKLEPASTTEKVIREETVDETKTEEAEETGVTIEQFHNLLE